MRRGLPFLVFVVTLAVHSQAWALPAVTISVGSTTSTSVTVTWPVQSGVAQYVYFLNGNEVAPGTLYTGNNDPQTSYTFTGLTIGTSYNFRVDDWWYDGQYTNFGASSNTLSYTLVGSAVPTAPTGVSASAASNGSSAAVIWTAVTATPAVSSYKVYRGGALLASTSGSPYSDTTVTLGAVYTYSVSALNSVGEGSQGSASSITIPNVPGAPAGLAGNSTSSGTGVALSWSAVTGATSYSLYRDTSLTAFVTAISGTTYTDTGLLQGSTHQYQVSATNAVGEGSKSSAITVACVNVPGVPVNLAATAPSSSVVVLSWQAADSVATSYQIFRGATSLGTVPASTLTFTDSSAAANTNYTYSVEGVDSAGTSAPATVSVTTPVGGGPTTAPSGSGGVLVPQHVSVSASGQTVTVSWDAITSGQLKAVASAAVNSGVQNFSGVWGWTTATVPAGSSPAAIPSQGSPFAVSYTVTVGGVSIVSATNSASVTLASPGTYVAAVTASAGETDASGFAWQSTSVANQYVEVGTLTGYYATGVGVSSPVVVGGGEASNVYAIRISGSTASTVTVSWPVQTNFAAYEFLLDGQIAGESSLGYLGESSTGAASLVPDSSSSFTFTGLTSGDSVTLQVVGVTKSLSGAVNYSSSNQLSWTVGSAPPSTQASNPSTQPATMPTMGGLAGSEWQAVADAVSAWVGSLPSFPTTQATSWSITFPWFGGGTHDFSVDWSTGYSQDFVSGLRAILSLFFPIMLIHRVVKDIRSY